MIITMGKELPKGFSHNTSHMSYSDIDEALKIISKKVPPEREIISTSLTPLSEMSRLYIPSVLKYSEDTAPFLDPREIYKHCITGEDSVRPHADFVIFDNSDLVACLAYSKEAPVICFEGLNSGKKCIGTILKNALINDDIIDITFTKILANLKDSEISVTVALATKYSYPDLGMNLREYIKKVCKNYDVITRSDTYLAIDPQDEISNCYSRYDEGNRSNNAVILW